MARKKKKIPHKQILFWLFAAAFGITFFYTLHQTNTSSILGTQTTAKPTPISQTQLAALASNKYSTGNLPLGDGKYTTTGAKKGYVYLCNVNKGRGGAQGLSPWIHGTTWNYKEKLSVSGKIAWKNASFISSINGSTRSLSGNSLPLSHTTGVFPVAATDPAYQYDKNPNTITANAYTQSLPTNPTYSGTPYCMGGEVGVMNTGVVLFNGFDAELRDAVARELQDGCGGHPQEKGQYHYHGLSNCITNIGVTTVIGYALDGFPITGPKVAADRYLTTDNLDECHGITSDIMLDEKKTSMYHYVMTQDFPYSVSCFRGKPVSLQINKTGNGQANNSKSSTMQQPPKEAMTACSGKTSGASCSFTSPKGLVTGSCQIPPGQGTTICVPRY